MLRLFQSASRHFVLFLTVRYLLRRPLSFVAIVAVTVAVAILVVAPSVMNGFQDEFHARVRGTASDLSITSQKPFGIERQETIEKAIAATTGVVAVAPFLENPALDKHQNKIDYCFFRGIDPRAEAKVGDFEKNLVSPQGIARQLWFDPVLMSQKQQQAFLKLFARWPDVVDAERTYRLLETGDPDFPGIPTCLLGIFLLDVYQDDITRAGTGPYMYGKITLTTASDSGEVNENREYLVVGAVQTGFYQNDRHTVYMSLENAQKLVKAPNRVTGYSVRIGDYAKAPETRKVLRSIVRDAFEKGTLSCKADVRTWEEKDQNLLKAVGMEKLLIRLLMGFMVIGTSTSILLVLVTTVYSKVRELGILRAVGGGRFGVFVLFIGQGLVLATVAMVLGCALGVVFSTYINEIADVVHGLTGWHPFPKDVYYLERIPTKLLAKEILEDYLFTLGIAVGFGFIPAFIASLRPPLRAIRYE